MQEKAFTVKFGYSPERINPGRNANNLTDIVKITSGEDEDASKFIDDFYKASIVKAGTYSASSIKVAEAAKVLENTQRDVNIALVNELALICSRLNINTNDVIDAASTKWNFMEVRPGLVGGHCIGVDPYYLAYKAEMVDVRPDLILAGRRINDGMAGWIARRAVKLIVKNKGRLNMMQSAY